MPVSHRQQDWLTDRFHAAFREMMLHVAAREGLVCPAYCLMPDHIHLVWMGLRRDTDQRNGVKFFRAQISPFLKPAKFQHQAHDHVLQRERQRHALSLACADYVLLNPLKGGLVKKPGDWPHLGAVVPGYPRAIRSTPATGRGFGGTTSPCANRSRETSSRRAKWNDVVAADVQSALKLILQKDIRIGKLAPTDVGGYRTEAAVDVNPR